MALAMALVGCRPSDSAKECERLLEHFLDVEAAAATAGRFSEMTSGMKAGLEEQKRQFRQSLESAFVGKCRQLLSSAEIACALNAADQASMDRCEGR